MVQIYIKKSDSQVGECLMIELQGDLEVENNESLANRYMGDLYYNKDGTPVLILGHHVLYGRVVNLDKPMVLLKKSVTKLATDEWAMSESENSSMSDDTSESKSRTDYLIEAVIKQKLLFNKRPRPIVYIDNAKKN